MLFSCAAPINVAKYEPIRLSTFDNESYHEYLVDFQTITDVEKDLVRYFEKRIYNAYKNETWMSCNKSVGQDQKVYMAKWWSLQGILLSSDNERGSMNFAFVILLAMGTPKAEVEEFMYAVTYKRIYSKYLFDMCAYNPEIHRG
jgi:hypothetical protein